MRKTGKVTGQKRKRTTFDSPQREVPNKALSKVLRKKTQLEPLSKHNHDPIRSLKSEIQALKSKNEALKSENEALKRELKKKHPCQICGKCYSRSDALYKHLWEGDQDHKALAEERYRTRCEFADDKDSELNGDQHLDRSPTLNPINAVLLTEDLTTMFPPSTPPAVAMCESSIIISGESPGFSNNPVYPLNAEHDQLVPSSYIATVNEAPSFADNPAYLLNHMSAGHALPLPCDANATNGSSLGTNLVHSPYNVLHAQTLHPFYNTANAEAPSFMTSPANPLNDAVFGQPTPSLYNAVNRKAPVMSNKVFGWASQSLSNSASLGSQFFSGHP
ncbi:MAG: hypothetical protein Q9217_005198 [Psora testacea]